VEHNLKILAVSDVVENRLYIANVKEKFPTVELLLGCGDLPFEYLEFLVSSFNVPLLYVPGNHDPRFFPSNPAARADGCENIDRQVVQVKGLSIAGLGGSIQYRPGAVNQYTQSDMWMRAAGLAPALLWSQLSRGRVLDIMIAHSPPFGIHDDDDQPHTGFKAFVSLIKTFQPRYFLHGHTLAYKNNLDDSHTMLKGTQVININPYRVIDVEGHV
jgi:uncharacterized protein